MMCYDVVNYIVYGVVKDLVFGESCLIIGFDEEDEDEGLQIFYKFEFDKKESVLEKYCVDFNVKFCKGDVDFLIGCDYEVECCI